MLFKLGGIVKMLPFFAFCQKNKQLVGLLTMIQQQPEQKSCKFIK